MLFAFAVLVTAGAARAAQPAIGINYLWWSFTPVSLHDCKVEKEPQSVGAWVVPNYQDENVRAAARAQLRAMRAAGFSTLRTVLIYDRSSDPDPTAFTSLDGSVSAGDRDKLQSFVRDVGAAGFTTLEIVSSFDSENWIYCRNHAWGDCFNPARTSDNWRFISQTAQAAIAAAGPLALRFDLGNEQAPDPICPLARWHARRRISDDRRRFQAAYGDGWLFSMARSDDSTAAETSERLDLLVADLGDAGLKPKYLELHSYSNDGNDMVQSLDAAQTIARRIDAMIVLGELRYHSSAQASAIDGWVRKNPQSRLIDVILWPEFDPSQACAILPSLPYTPGPLLPGA